MDPVAEDAHHHHHPEEEEDHLLGPGKAPGSGSSQMKRFKPSRFPGIYLLPVVFLVLSCDNQEEQPAAVSKQEASPVSATPPAAVEQEPAGPEIESTDPRLQKKNGRFAFEGSPFTGSVTERYEDGALKNRISYRDGLKDGPYQAWWSGGGSRLALQYKRGRKYGLQQAWWENGNRRYTLTTFPGGPEGKKEEWYESGQQYRLMNYKGGREDGLQLGWFSDGKRHFNYVYRAGRRYGLPGKRICEGGE